MAPITHLPSSQLRRRREQTQPKELRSLANNRIPLHAVKDPGDTSANQNGKLDDRNAKHGTDLATATTLSAFT